MSSNLVMTRLSAAVRALREADVSGLTDDALGEHLAELSAGLCEVDAHLARLAEAVRARGYAIVEGARLADDLCADDLCADDPRTEAVNAECGEPLAA